MIAVSELFVLLFSRHLYFANFTNLESNRENQLYCGCGPIVVGAWLAYAAGTSDSIAKVLARRHLHFLTPTDLYLAMYHLLFQ